MSAREYPLRPLAGVGAVVIDAGRVLLIRRGREPSLGEWSLPGGLVKVGEPLARALRREVEEETGLQVAVGELIEVLDRIIRDDSGWHDAIEDDAGRVQYHYIILDYLCRLEDSSQGSRVQPASDATDARWVELDELGPMQLSPAVLRVIRRGFQMAQPS